MPKYRVRVKGFVIVEASSPEEAIEKHRIEVVQKRITASLDDEATPIAYQVCSTCELYDCNCIPTTDKPVISKTFEHCGITFRGRILRDKEGFYETVIERFIEGEWIEDYRTFRLTYPQAIEVLNADIKEIYEYPE